jgi:hypothetical protein
MSMSMSMSYSCTHYCAHDIYDILHTYMTYIYITILHSCQMSVPSTNDGTCSKVEYTAV